MSYDGVPVSLRAVLFDFGGVIFDSPFDAFARYEQAQGLPKDFIRTINATNPDVNAWAQFERTQVSFEVFCELFEAEAASAGHALDARAVMTALDGTVRPSMITALERLRVGGFKLAGLTNNVARADTSERAADHARAHDELKLRFDVVIESSKVGVRKPEIRFYELACQALDVKPAECVFLDDLGVNLKPAAAMGMRTIKVLSAEQAIGELEAAVGISLS